MLRLSELERAVGVVAAERRGARLERAVQRDQAELELVLSGGTDRRASDRLILVLCCAPGLARVSSRPKLAPAPPAPLPFAQYLRAHLVGGRLQEARIVDGDRQAGLVFEGSEGRFELLLSILGPRSNVYLLGDERGLVLSLRPLAETRRDLSKGEPWRSPETPPPAPGEDRFAEVGGEELLAAIEDRFAGEAEGAETATLRRRIAQALKKQRAALARKERRVTQDLGAEAASEEAQRLGELLKGALSAVRPRAESVQATDPASGETVEIPLDPALGAAANLEAYFRRAKKAAKRALRARQDLGALEERIAAAEALASEQEATSDADLEGFAARDEIARLLERFASAPRAREAAAKAAPAFKLGGRELATRLVPKRYRTREGLEVWVGKNDEGNDLLTTRLARGRDLFFHLEASPGSHVVLRVEGKGDPPQESVLDAAELAVHFSKQRNTTRARVHVAAIKDVSKPKGVKPGLVYVHRGRSLDLRREPARLERLLGARIDG